MDDNVMTRDERIRFECLLQANMHSNGESAEETVNVAAEFETYVKVGKEGVATNGS